METHLSEVTTTAAPEEKKKLRKGFKGIPAERPKLYPFYTRWGIAFARVFDYSHSQGCWLIGAIQCPSGEEILQ